LGDSRPKKTKPKRTGWGRNKGVEKNRRDTWGNGISHANILAEGDPQCQPGEIQPPRKNREKKPFPKPTTCTVQKKKLVCHKKKSRTKAEPSPQKWRAGPNPKHKSFVRKNLQTMTSPEGNGKEGPGVNANQEGLGKPKGGEGFSGSTKKQKPTSAGKTV